MNAFVELDFASAKFRRGVDHLQQKEDDVSRHPHATPSISEEIAASARELKPAVTTPSNQ